MEEQIEYILNNQNKQGYKVQLSNLKHNPKEKNKVDYETVTRLQKLKKYALHDSSIPSEKLSNYFCSLCGRLSLITNVLIEKLPKRKTDGAIAIELRSNFTKFNLQRDKIKYIMRYNGLETQYRWKCECGIPVGYTAINYYYLEEARMNYVFTCSNRPYFYVYNDALVERLKESKLISEIITYKYTILLHLKRKTKK